MKFPETDTRLSAVNPEGVAYSLRPAGLISRALAYAVDSVIIWTILLALLLVAYGLNLDTGNWIMLLAVFVVNWFYFTLWEIFSHGSTPGKKLLGLKVVADDGAPVSPSASFTRNLLRFADSFLGLILIGVLTMIFSPAFRRLGDWAASTLVVMIRPYGEGTGSTILQKEIQPKVPEIPLKSEEKSAVLSFFRRFNHFGEARADEIASKVVPAITADEESIKNPSGYIISLALGFLGREKGR